MSVFDVKTSYLSKEVIEEYKKCFKETAKSIQDASNDAIVFRPERTKECVLDDYQMEENLVYTGSTPRIACEAERWGDNILRKAQIVGEQLCLSFFNDLFSSITAALVGAIRACDIDHSKIANQHTVQDFMSLSDFYILNSIKRSNVKCKLIDPRLYRFIRDKGSHSDVESSIVASQFIDSGRGYMACDSLVHNTAEPTMIALNKHAMTVRDRKVEVIFEMNNDEKKELLLSAKVSYALDIKGCYFRSRRDEDKYISNDELSDENNWKQVAYDKRHTAGALFTVKESDLDKASEKK